MTGTRADPGHEEQPPGSTVDDRPPGPLARNGAVAPQPRHVPAADPAPPAATPPAPPGPTRHRTAPGQSARDPDRPGEVEPTTGAPVDAVPRRVPVRQPTDRFRPGPVGNPPASDDDGLFWAPIEEVHWDGTPLREEHRRRRWWRRDTGRGAGGRGPRPTRPPEPWQGLSALLALSLLASFFAWVSASPFWVAVGHATTGTVVVSECTGGGLTQRCRGIFTADGNGFAAFGVRIDGVPAGRTTAGSALPARMTGSTGDTAYADTGAGRHLRWLLGLTLVLGCGVAIARGTGATLLTDRRARRWVVAASVAGPCGIAAGFLTAAW